MNTANVISTFAAAGLGHVAQDIARVSQPSIRIHAAPTDESRIPLGASKLGGLPDLPVIFEWPALNGIPMSFITQIRLEDLHGIDAAQVLPPAGMLWFFYDAQQNTYGSDPGDRAGRQLFYVDNLSSTRLQRLPAPAALPADGRFKACAVTFSSEITIPERPTMDAPSLRWSPDDQQHYEALYAAFPSQEDHTATHHRLLGHPDTLQDDMRSQCALLAHGVSSNKDPRAAGLMQNAMNWQLLLQVDSDANAGMRWASTGILYFWIEKDALKTRNFDNTWVVLQSE